MTSETHRKSLPASSIYLYFINALYLLLGIIVIAVVASAQSRVNVYLPAFSQLQETIRWCSECGIIAAWALLVVVACLGLYGTRAKKQLIIFVYMVLLSLLFIIMFGSSVATLSISSSQQRSLLEGAWCGSSESAVVVLVEGFKLLCETVGEIQRQFDCFGFSNSSSQMRSCFDPITAPKYCPRGCKAACTPDKPKEPTPTKPCEPCFDKLKPNLQKYLNSAGGVGLTFAFTMFFGIWAAWTHRYVERSKALSYC
eukprot:gene3346-6018_t